MDLPEYKKQWNEWVNSLYGDPKYKYHKDHPKRLSEDSTAFRDFHSSIASVRNEK